MLIIPFSYLNGLLQTLFMTPEFRRAVLAWPYSLKAGETEDQCIPLQLQKLFGMLQLSTNRSIDTVALTKYAEHFKSRSILLSIIPTCPSRLGLLGGIAWKFFSSKMCKKDILFPVIFSQQCCLHT